MNDLISRSELLEKFTFDFDGEIIPEHDADNFPVVVPISKVKSMIRETPTAFDVDKVIDTLKVEISKIENLDLQYPNTYTNDGILVGISFAIRVLERSMSERAEPPKTG